MARRCSQSGGKCSDRFFTLCMIALVAGCLSSDPLPHTLDVEITPVVDPGTEIPFQAPDRAIAEVLDRDQKASGDYQKREPEKDFVARNGPIFTDWKRPQLAILFSGMLDGYIEPCGCAGLENQKGGLGRRHALVERLRQKDWPVVNFDLGGMVRRFGPQAAIKYQVAIDAHRIIDYAAIGLGERDLKLPTEILLAQLVQDEESPFVSANVRSAFDNDFGLTRRYRTIEAGGLRIGVTQVLGEAVGETLQNVDFQYETPADALPPVIEKMESEKCDLLILLANVSLDEARELAQEFSEFDYVVVAGDSDPPPPQPERIEGTPARLIELGPKGMYVGVLGVYETPKRSFRYQRVPLDGRFTDSAEISALLTAYQDQLKGQGLAGLGLRANPHPSGRRFAGSEACAKCHSDEFEIWQETPHSHATETLVQLPIPRQFDPECLSCHVTGWDPQEYYPFVSGYESLRKTPHLVGNGCENCHGGGVAHVAAESGDVDAEEAELERLREGMRLTIKQAQRNVCVRCHDLDNSPDFDFEKYWPEVEH